MRPVPARTFVNAGMRALKFGVPYTINRQNIPAIPDNCPVCGVAMDFGRPTTNSPSLDRIVPALGYVPDNVRWICMVCNIRKGNRVPA